MSLPVTSPIRDNSTGLVTARMNALGADGIPGVQGWREQAGHPRAHARAIDHRRRPAVALFATNVPPQTPQAPHPPPPAPPPPPPLPPLRAIHERGHNMAEYEVPGSELIGERVSDVRKTEGILTSFGTVRQRFADHNNESAALHTDEDIRVQTPCGATQVVNIELWDRSADEHRDFAVTVPSQCCDPTRQLIVGLTGED